MSIKNDILKMLNEGKNFLKEDDELDKAKLDFENFLKSNTNKISEHEKNILKKLVLNIEKKAYQSGSANKEFEMSD